MTSQSHSTCRSDYLIYCFVFFQFVDAVARDPLPNNAIQMEHVIANPISWVINATNVSMDSTTALHINVSNNAFVTQSKFANINESGQQ